MKKIYIVFIGLLFLAMQGFSQQGALLYTMEKIPQVNSVNPSFFPQNKWWIQIFSISPTIYSPLSFSDVIKNNPDNSKSFVGTEAFMDALTSTNRLQIATDVNFLSFGFRASDWMFTWNNTTRIHANIEIEKDLFGILLQGNTAYEGKTATLADADFGEALVYQEFALGVGKKLNEQWTVGGKAKFLIGGLHITTGASNLTLTTENDYDKLTLSSKIDGRMSSLAKFDSTDFDDADYESPSNYGFGFDLGATYKLNEKFEFSASLLDIGYIRWTQNLKKIVNDGTGFLAFSGEQIDSIINNGEISAALQDSLEKAIDINFEEGGTAYTTRLPFKFMLSGSYRILPSLKASIMYRGEVFSSHYYSSATIDLNYTVGNWFEVSVGNSFVGSSFFNPGIGMNFTIANTWQIFLAANYVSSIYATDIRTVSGMFGMNLTFGKSGNTKKNIYGGEGIEL